MSCETSIRSGAKSLGRKMSVSGTHRDVPTTIMEEEEGATDNDEMMGDVEILDEDSTVWEESVESRVELNLNVGGRRT